MNEFLIANEHMGCFIYPRMTIKTLLPPCNFLSSITMLKLCKKKVINIEITSRNIRSISKYVYKMPFPLSQKLKINRLIEYRVNFTLYQRLNASFDWVFNGFGRFLIGRSIFARGGLPGLVGPSPFAKMLRLIRKRPNPSNIQSNSASNRW